MAPIDWLEVKTRNWVDPVAIVAYRAPVGLPKNTSWGSKGWLGTIHRITSSI